MFSRWRAAAPWWSGVGCGAIVVLISALARMLVVGPSLERFPYLTFWPAVVVAALIGGLPGGLWAALFSALIVHSAFVPLRDGADWFDLLMFLSGSAFTVVVIELLLRARSREMSGDVANKVRAQLAAIVESSSDAILSKDLDGVISTWNIAATRLFGYQPDEIVGQSIMRIIPPDLFAEEDAIIARLKKGERVEHYETTRVAKDGHMIEVSLTISPIVDGDGAVVGASKIIRDISELTWAERKHLAVQQRLQLAAETTGVGVWEWDVTAERMIWDAQMFRLYGVPPTRDGVVAYDVWANAVLPEDLAKQEQLLRKYEREGGVGRRQFRIRRQSDSELRYIEAVESLRRDVRGKVVALVGSNLDVTERRHFEETLRESEAQVRFALEGAHAGAWRWDVPTNRSTWSDDFYRMHGRMPGVDEPSYATWLDSVHPDNRDAAIATVSDALERRTSNYRSEYRVIAFGQTRWLSILGKVDFAADGSPLRMSGISLDVTDQKMAELGRRESEAALLQSKTLLRHAADAARLTFAQFDLAARTVKVGDNFERVMGFTPRTPPQGGSFENARAGLLAQVAVDDRSTVMAMFEEIFAGERAGKVAYRVNGADGVQRWFEESWNPDIAAGGKARHVFAAILDITLPVARESELREAKAKAEEILSSIGDGFYALDSDWRIVYFNTRAEAMLGKKRDAVVGRRFLDVFPMVSRAPRSKPIIVG